MVLITLKVKILRMTTGISIWCNHSESGSTLISSFSYGYCVTQYSTQAQVIKNYYKSWTGSWSTMYLSCNIVNKNHHSRCVGFSSTAFYLLFWHVSVLLDHQWEILYTHFHGTKHVCSSFKEFWHTKYESVVYSTLS